MSLFNLCEIFYYHFVKRSYLRTCWYNQKIIFNLMSNITLSRNCSTVCLYKVLNCFFISKFLLNKIVEQPHSRLQAEFLGSSVVFAYVRVGSLCINFNSYSKSVENVTFYLYFLKRRCRSLVRWLINENKLFI